jgi:hypothetical protein
MRHTKAVTVISVLALAAAAALSGGPSSVTSVVGVSPAEAQTPVVYKPPLRGAPGGRVGGGTRGVSSDTLVVSVLAPDHTGLTTEESPVLYWLVSKPTNHPVEIAVTAVDDTTPVLELTLPGPTAAGIHKIALADHGVRLRSRVTYQWFVAVVLNPQRRTRDVLAGGTIERVALGDDVRAKLAQAPPDERPGIYAAAGLWYDAVAEVYRLIAAAPADVSLRTLRDALIAQAGVKDTVQRQP